MEGLEPPRPKTIISKALAANQANLSCVNHFRYIGIMNGVCLSKAWQTHKLNFQLGTHERTRTFTNLILSQVPLPIGLHGQFVVTEGFEPSISNEPQILSLRCMPVPSRY